MTHYGGLGGVETGRQVNRGDKFELAVYQTLRGWIREDPVCAEAMWSALANVDWVHDNGHTAAYSFSSAGDLVAAVVGRSECHVTYSCGGQMGVVCEYIAEELRSMGWRPVILEATAGNY